jgi:hypothetical protein
MTSIFETYGFPVTWDLEAEDGLKESYERHDAKIAHLWEEFVNENGHNFHHGDLKLKKLIREGVPKDLRAAVWCSLSGSTDRCQDHPDLYPQLVGMEANLSAETIRVIDQDVARTFPKVACVDSAALRRILVAFASLRVDIGYCQSISYISALLLVMLGELQAFWTLDWVVNNLPSHYYTNDMSDFQLDIRVTELLLNERVPKLCKHTKRIGFEFIMAVSGWLISLFSVQLPIPTVIRIWDVFFFEGSKILFRVVIGLMRCYEPQLLDAAELPDFTDLIHRRMKNEIDSEYVLTQAFGIRAFSRKHIQQIRKDLSETLEEDEAGAQAAMSKFHMLWGRLGI